MLPRQHRLPLRTEFRRVKKQGKVVQSKSFSLLFCPRLPVTGSRPVSRFAFIVSKKTQPLAVRRNKIRRLLSESVYRLLSRVVPGYDLIFLTKKTISEAGLVAISQEISQILDNEKLFLKTD